MSLIAGIGTAAAFCGENAELAQNPLYQDVRLEMENR